MQSYSSTLKMALAFGLVATLGACGGEEPFYVGDPGDEGRAEVQVPEQLSWEPTVIPLVVCGIYHENGALTEMECRLNEGFIPDPMHCGSASIKMSVTVQAAGSRLVVDNAPLSIGHLLEGNSQQFLIDGALNEVDVYIKVDVPFLPNLDVSSEVKYLGFTASEQLSVEKPTATFHAPHEVWRLQLISENVRLMRTVSTKKIYDWPLISPKVTAYNTDLDLNTWPEIYFLAPLGSENFKLEVKAGINSNYINVEFMHPGFWTVQEDGFLRESTKQDFGL